MDERVSKWLIKVFFFYFKNQHFNSGVCRKIWHTQWEQEPNQGAVEHKQNGRYCLNMGKDSRLWALLHVQLTSHQAVKEKELVKNWGWSLLVAVTSGGKSRSSIVFNLFLFMDVHQPVGVSSWQRPHSERLAPASEAPLRPRRVAARRDERQIRHVRFELWLFSRRLSSLCLPGDTQWAPNVRLWVRVVSVYRLWAWWNHFLPLCCKCLFDGLFLHMLIALHEAHRLVAFYFASFLRNKLSGNHTD